MRRAFAALRIDFSRFVFIDLGSGKGRTLLLAAEWPFLRVEGIEFASELHHIAKKNIKAFVARRLGCQRITALHIDAAEYRIPDAPCVFYLYNPFGEPVLARVLDNIEASFERDPRPMYFVYLNPKHRHIFEHKSFVRPITRRWSPRVVDRIISPEPLAFYRSTIECIADPAEIQS